MSSLNETRINMNINALRALALIIAFASGAFAHSFYFKSPKDTVQLQRTDSGLFVLSEGHLYTVEKLEMVRDSEGASQSYHLPTGRR